MTRAMLAQALYRLDGAPSVTGASPFADTSAVSAIWANANSIVNGTGGGKFSPDAEITREQLAVMMYRYAQLTVDGDARDLSGFPDADNVSDWAEDAVIWAVSAGLIQGRGDALAPKGTATRAEVAAILQRFIEQL
jgi:hypothetical protein